MACPSTFTTPQPYEPRRPELTPLYRIVSTHLPAFLDRTDQAGGIPVFVRDELTSFLD